MPEYTRTTLVSQSPDGGVVRVACASHNLSKAMRRVLVLGAVTIGLAVLLIPARTRGDVTYANWPILVGIGAGFAILVLAVGFAAGRVSRSAEGSRESRVRRLLRRLADDAEE